MSNAKIRSALGVLAVAFALVTVFATKPSSDNSRALIGILIDADVNNDRAEGAPQQQVVNGWTTRDLLALQSRQLDQLSSAVWGVSWLVAIAVGLLGFRTFASQSDSLDARSDDHGPSSGPLAPPSAASIPSGLRASQPVSGSRGLEGGPRSAPRI